MIVVLLSPSLAWAGGGGGDAGGGGSTGGTGTAGVGRSGAGSNPGNEPGAPTGTAGAGPSGPSGQGNMGGPSGPAAGSVSGNPGNDGGNPGVSAGGGGYSAGIGGGSTSGGGFGSVGGDDASDGFGGIGAPDGGDPGLGAFGGPGADVGGGFGSDFGDVGGFGAGDFGADGSIGGTIGGGSSDGGNPGNAPGDATGAAGAGPSGPSGQGNSGTSAVSGSLSGNTSRSPAISAEAIDGRVATAHSVANNTISSRSLVPSIANLSMPTQSFNPNPSNSLNPTVSLSPTQSFNPSFSTEVAALSGNTASFSRAPSQPGFSIAASNISNSSRTLGTAISGQQMGTQPFSVANPLNRSISNDLTRALSSFTKNTNQLASRTGSFVPISQDNLDTFAVINGAAEVAANSRQPGETKSIAVDLTGLTPAQKAAIAEAAEAMNAATNQAKNQAALNSARTNLALTISQNINNNLSRVSFNTESTEINPVEVNIDTSSLSDNNQSTNTNPGQQPSTVSKASNDSTSPAESTDSQEAQTGQPTSQANNTSNQNPANQQTSFSSNDPGQGGRSNTGQVVDNSVPFSRPGNTPDNRSLVTRILDQSAAARTQSSGGGQNDQSSETEGLQPIDVPNSRVHTNQAQSLTNAEQAAFGQNNLSSEDIETAGRVLAGEVAAAIKNNFVEGFNNGGVSGALNNLNLAEMQAVAAILNVANNRVNLADTNANTLTKTFRQPAQFTTFSRSFSSQGEADYAANPEAYNAVARAFMDGTVARNYGYQAAVPTRTATHYHATYVNPAWASRLTKLTTLGSHTFYTVAGTGHTINSIDGIMVSQGEMASVAVPAFRGAADITRNLANLQQTTSPITAPMSISNALRSTLTRELSEQAESLMAETEVDSEVSAGSLSGQPADSRSQVSDPKPTGAASPGAESGSTDGSGSQSEGLANTQTVLPMTGSLNTDLGNTPAFGFARGRLHAGVDIYGPNSSRLTGPNNPVIAPEDGTVVRSQVHKGYGHTIDIRGKHTNRVYRLAHVAPPRDANGDAIGVGDSVNKGQAITYVTGSGTAFGRYASRNFNGDTEAAEDALNQTGWPARMAKPHLHMEVRSQAGTFGGNSVVDPTAAFPAMQKGNPMVAGASPDGLNGGLSQIAIASQQQNIPVPVQRPSGESETNNPVPTFAEMQQRRASGEQAGNNQSSNAAQSAANEAPQSKQNISVNAEFTSLSANEGQISINGPTDITINQNTATELTISGDLTQGTLSQDGTLTAASQSGISVNGPDLSVSNIGNITTNPNGSVSISGTESGMTATISDTTYSNVNSVQINQDGSASISGNSGGMSVSRNGGLGAVAISEINVDTEGRTQAQAANLFGLIPALVINLTSGARSESRQNDIANVVSTISTQVGSFSESLTSQMASLTGSNRSSDSPNQSAVNTAALSNQSTSYNASTDQAAQEAAMMGIAVDHAATAKARADGMQSTNVIGTNGTTYNVGTEISASAVSGQSSDEGQVAATDGFGSTPSNNPSDVTASNPVPGFDNNTGEQSDQPSTFASGVGDDSPTQNEGGSEPASQSFIGGLIAGIVGWASGLLGGNKTSSQITSSDDDVLDSFGTSNPNKNQSRLTSSADTNESTSNTGNDDGSNAGTVASYGNFSEGATQAGILGVGDVTSVDSIDVPGSANNTQTGVGQSNTVSGTPTSNEANGVNTSESQPVASSEQNQIVDSVTSGSISQQSDDKGPTNPVTRALGKVVSVITDLFGVNGNEVSVGTPTTGFVVTDQQKNNDSLDVASTTVHIIQVDVTADIDTGDLDFYTSAIYTNSELDENYDADEIYALSLSPNDESLPSIILDNEGYVFYSDGSYAPITIEGIAYENPHIEYVYTFQVVEDGQLTEQGGDEFINDSMIPEFLSDILTDNSSFSIEDVVSVTSQYTDPRIDRPLDEYNTYTIKLADGGQRVAILPEFTNYSNMQAVFSKTGYQGNVLQLLSMAVDVTRLEEQNLFDRIISTAVGFASRIIGPADSSTYSGPQGALSAFGNRAMTTDNVKSVDVYYNVNDIECVDSANDYSGYYFDLTLDAKTLVGSENDTKLRFSRCGFGGQDDYLNAIAIYLVDSLGFAEVDIDQLSSKTDFFDVELYSKLNGIEVDLNNVETVQVPVNVLPSETEPVLLPNLTNEVTFEVKATDRDGNVLVDWVYGDLTINEAVELHFRWDGQAYEQCLPFLADSGNYALTRSRVDANMTTGNTESEGYNINERSGTYRVECGGQRNLEFGVDVREIEVRMR